jgi:hypothetical protein
VEKGKMEIKTANYVNQVVLQGRVSGVAASKKLPSGDSVVQFRLIIDRGNSGLNRKSKASKSRNVSQSKKDKNSKSGKAGKDGSSSKTGNKSISRREVDTLDIGVWRKDLQKKSLTLVAEQFVNVKGAIRRSFWSTPNGLASRYQIEAFEIEKM